MIGLAVSNEQNVIPVHWVALESWHGKIFLYNGGVQSQSHTFSLSVLINFLSSLFFSFPGASAIGKDVWNRNSFPAHSAAWGQRQATRLFLLYSAIIHSSFSLLFIRHWLCDTGWQLSIWQITQWEESEGVAGDSCLTFRASIPAWITGANTVSVSLVSANISGIWSNKLKRQMMADNQNCHSDFSCLHSQFPE